MPSVLYAYDNLREELRYIEGAIAHCTGRERERLVAGRDKKKTELADLYEHYVAYERLCLVH